MAFKKKPTPSNLPLPPMHSDSFGRTFLLAVLIGVTVIFVQMVRVFLLPVLLAAVFTTLFYPLFNWLLDIQKERRWLAALLTCLLLFIGLLLPLYFIGNLVTREAIHFYQTAGHEMREMLQKGDDGPLGRVRNSGWFRSMELDRVDWPATLQAIGARASGWFAGFIGRTSGNAVQVVAGVFVTLFIMFYFFRDGPQLLARIKYLIPLPEEYEDALIARFVKVSRATIKGTLVIGLIQSTIGALTLWAFGVASPALWWVVMVVLSMIPIVGAWAVMHPAAIVQILIGNVWQGVGIFLITVLIISTIDNILRPRLVGQFTGMHDLVVFFSAFGGITMFGPLGVIVGPIIAAFFMTILEIYSMEFKHQLDQTGTDPELVETGLTTETQSPQRNPLS